MVVFIYLVLMAVMLICSPENYQIMVTSPKVFYSGLNSFETWSAKRDENAILPEAYSMTALKEGYERIDFSFPGLDGKKVSIADERFKNKVVLVQFFGSWCPNCMDETAYLTTFYSRYHEKGVEIIALDL